MELRPGEAAGPSPADMLSLPLPFHPPTRLSREGDFQRRNNGSVDARQSLAARATTVDPVTCGYPDGDGARPRTADAGYNCRVDVSQGLWGFCPTSVLYARDCGLAAACIDAGACSRGCGNSAGATLTTFTCTDKGQDFCSTALLDSGPDQTYSYIACAATPATVTLLAASTAGSGAETSTTSESSSNTEASRFSATPSNNIPSPASGLSNPAPTSSANSAPDSSSPDNTGTIVGGVVGGIALICLTVLAVVLVLRRGRRRSDKAAGATNDDDIGYGRGELDGAAARDSGRSTKPYYTGVPVAELGAPNAHVYAAELDGGAR